MDATYTVRQRSATEGCGGMWDVVRVMAGPYFEEATARSLARSYAGFSPGRTDVCKMRATTEPAHPRTVRCRACGEPADTPFVRVCAVCQRAVLRGRKEVG